ncbi:MAG TPA: ABC transporter permease [Candidatus Acidoferrales bacterium]|jgi:putative ABC transport system permease protein|nr:ABC transporter permease [Candidatus Acidoferrales bacterium]
MMLRNETWLVALDALWANKIRAFLTTLGVIIGSACIVLVVTVALSGRRYVLQQIEGIGSNLVYAVLEIDPNQPIMLQDELSIDDMNAAKNGIPGVVVAAGTRDSPETVNIGSVERNVNLVGVTEGFQQIRNLLILRGRFLDTEDDASRSRVCVISTQLASFAFPFVDAVGQRLRVGELDFTVVGVFRERVETFGQSEIKDFSVLIPFPLMKNYLGDSSLSTLYLQTATADDVIPVTNKLVALLASRHPTRSRYSVRNFTSILQAARNIALALTIVLLLIGFIALLVSGIGIMNIMLVTVQERTREIGIRKAIGARHKEILYQFLVEAFLISGFGSVLGILIAVAIPVIARPWLPEYISVPVPWESVVLAFLVSCSVGIFFGYLPAERASKLQPTESLRYE